MASRLRPSALRLPPDASAGAASDADAAPATGTDGRTTWLNPDLTRRQVLGAMGTAALLPALLDGADAAFGRVSVVPEPDRLTVRLGAHTYVLDARHYDAAGPSRRPRLTVATDGATVTARLAGALFPGTSAVADVLVRLAMRRGAWHLRAERPDGAAVEGPVATWLTGERSLATTVRATADLHAPGAAVRVRVAGPADLAYGPDGSWTYATSGRVTVAMPEGTVEAGTLRVGLAPDAAPGAAQEASLFARPAARRSVLAAGDVRTSSVRVQPGSGQRWRLATAADGPPAVESVRVETARTARGALREAVRVDGRDDARWTVEPVPGAAATLALGLRSVRYAAVYGGRPEQAVEARFAAESRLSGPTAAAVFGDADGAVFRLRALGAEVVEAVCRPFLRAAALLPGGSDTIAWPADAGLAGGLAGGTLVDVAAGRARRRAGGLPVVGLDARRGATFAVDGFTVAMVRPRDLAVFVFGFEGITVQGSGPGARLVASGGSARLTALLAPQTFGEQAFFRTAPAGTAQTPTPDVPQGGQESPGAPAGGRIAGPSRLVFKVPASTEIPYTLEGILAALRGLALSVAPNAFSPQSSALLGGTLTGNATLNSFGLNGAALTGVLATPAGGFRNTALGGLSPIGRRLGEGGVGVAAGGIAAGGIASGRLVRTSRSGVAVASPTITVASGPVLVSGVLNPAASPSLVGAAALVAGARAVRYGRATATGQSIAEFGFESVAVPPPARAPGVPEAPRLDETALEAVYRLVLSPDQRAGLVHLSDPGVSPQTRAVELWHTRLVGRRAEDPADLAHVGPATASLRALWYTDPDLPAAGRANPLPLPAVANAPFRTSLNARQRHQIVHQTANHATQTVAYAAGAVLIRAGGTGTPPAPAQARRLHLSALGADLDARGAWDERPQGFALSEWVHRATVGRDQFVRVVEEGWLFPTGHRAALVTVTERKLSDSGLAFLAQRMFVVVREPVVAVATGLSAPGGSAADPAASRDLESPFSRLELLTLTTPDLDNPAQTQESGQLQSLFWPAVGGQDVRFTVRAEDVEGGEHTFAMPLAFVEAGQITTAGTHRSAALNALFGGYNQIVVNPGQLTTGAYGPRKEVAMGGAPVAFARARTPGDTTLAAASVVFGAMDRATEPFFAPRMLAATAVVPALASVSGTGAVIVRYNAGYLARGLRPETTPAPSLDAVPTGHNPSELFLDVFTTDASAVPPEKAGGFVTLGLKPTALSRTQGPVGGSVTEAGGAGAGTFKPEAFFGGVPMPKLFGAFSITDLIGEQSIARAPKMVSDALAAGERLLGAAAAFAEYAGGAAGEANAVGGALAGALAQAETQAEAVLASVKAAFTARTLADAGSLTGQITSLGTRLTAVLDALGAPAAVAGLSGATRNALDGAARTLLGLATSKTVESVARVVQGLQDAAELRTRVEWSPKIRSYSAAGVKLFDAREAAPDPAALTVAAVFEARQNGGGPGATVTASLDRFAVNLPGNVARLDFDRLLFRSVSGRKAEVDVLFGGITFLGPLSFLEKIKDVIPLDGFSDPPYLDVSASGIVAGYTLDLPDVAVGAFSLTHIRLAAELQVPFLGETSLMFAIGRKEEPVNVIVLFLGGGAFFGVTFGMSGLVQIEAAIEAGAAVALNFGVAAGEVHAFVGIYFRLLIEGSTKTVELTAYFRVGGSVKVLGILTVSIELRLEMSYVAEGGNSGKLVGRAELKVKVELLFFSKTVKIQYERKLAGSNNDPTAYDALAASYPDPASLALAPARGWDLYLSAFA